MTDRKPAEAFHPGEFLAEELSDRGWTHADLARRCAWPTTFVRRLVEGRAPMTRYMAAELGAALGTSAELWISLQQAFETGREATR